MGLMSRQRGSIIQESVLKIEFRQGWFNVRSNLDS